MAEKLRVDIPVIVEGKYDKITLCSVLDATILTTEGFGVFRSKEKQALLRRLCAVRGVIILTDPDAGGTQIRAFLRGILPPERVHCLYIPRIKGKEKRKVKLSKSGTLGVEGMTPEILRRTFAPFASDAPPKRGDPITKTDFYEAGLSGTPDAAARRDALADALSLPPGMTANALLAAVNLLCTRSSFSALVATIGSGGCANGADFSFS